MSALLIALFVGVGFVSGQGEEEVIIEADVTAEVVETEELMEEGIVVSGEDTIIEEELAYNQESFTEEEAQGIFDNAEEINEEMMGDEIVIGEVVITSDEFIVLEIEDGTYKKVSTSSHKSGQRKRTGAFISLSKAQAGNVLTIVPSASTTVSAQGAGYVATTNMLTLKNKPAYALASGTSVILNGEEGGLSDLEVIGDDSLVTVITDENGDVIAVTILDEVEAKGNKKAWPWILAAIVVLGGVILITRKNQEVSEM